MYACRGARSSCSVEEAVILRLEDSHRLNEREKESVDYSDEKVVVKYTCLSLLISILVRKNYVIYLIICCK